VIKSATDIAHEWAIGGWGWETTSPKNLTLDQLQVAVLAGIYKKLNAIENLLRCPNIADGFVAMRALERLAREFWVRPRKKSKAKRKHSSLKRSRGRK